MDSDDILLLVLFLGGAFLLTKVLAHTSTSSDTLQAGASGNGVLGIPLSAMSSADQQSQLNRLLSSGLTAVQIQAQASSEYNRCISSGLQWTSTGCSPCSVGMQFKPVPAGYTGASTVGPDGSPYGCF